jgi:hypothetical protein
MSSIEFLKNVYSMFILSNISAVFPEFKPAPISLLKDVSGRRAVFPMMIPLSPKSSLKDGALWFLPATPFIYKEMGAYLPVQHHAGIFFGRNFLRRIWSSFRPEVVLPDIASELRYNLKSVTEENYIIFNPHIYSRALLAGSFRV